jgi:hypothetical protein
VADDATGVIASAAVTATLGQPMWIDAAFARYRTGEMGNLAPLSEG